jgi:hypothetical protein
MVQNCVFILGDCIEQWCSRKVILTRQSGTMRSEGLAKKMSNGKFLSKMEKLFLLMRLRIKLPWHQSSAQRGEVLHGYPCYLNIHHVRKRMDHSPMHHHLC